MVEVRFKPADVGAVADGSVTLAKLNSEVTDELAAKADDATVTAALANKVDGTGTSGDKKISKIGWDSATGEVVIDHEA